MRDRPTIGLLNFRLVSARVGAVSGRPGRQAGELKIWKSGIVLGAALYVLAEAIATDGVQI
jgi:hypothetical protein